MKCAFCGTEENKNTGNCIRCNAPMEKSVPEWEKQAPFFYKGYVVWALHNPCARLIDFQFWQGMTLIGNVKLSQEYMHEIEPMDGVDIMPKIFALFIASMDAK